MTTAFCYRRHRNRHHGHICLNPHHNHIHNAHPIIIIHHDYPIIVSVDTVIIFIIEEKKRTQPKEELRWRQSAECGEAAPAIVFWSFVSYSQIMALVKM